VRTLFTQHPDADNRGDKLEGFAVAPPVGVIPRHEGSRRSVSAASKRFRKFAYGLRMKHISRWNDTMFGMRCKNLKMAKVMKMMNLMKVMNFRGGSAFPRAEVRKSGSYGREGSTWALSCLILALLAPFVRCCL